MNNPGKEVFVLISRTNYTPIGLRGHLLIQNKMWTNEF